MPDGPDGRADRLAEPAEGDADVGVGTRVVKGPAQPPGSQTPRYARGPSSRQVRRTAIAVATVALGSLALLLAVSGIGGQRDGGDLSTGAAGQGTAAAQPVPSETTMSAPPLPAPLLLWAAGDVRTGQVALHFDRPVVEGGLDAAISLVVYGDTTKGCSTEPHGRAHEYFSGIGTDTIVTDASGLVEGTVYVTVGDGFVKSAADGTPYQSTGCIHISVSSSAPTTTGSAGRLELLSATGDDLSSRITLRFSQAVVVGDGPGEYGSAGPPPDNTRLAPMQLVFYRADSTCASPSGNAHQFLSGLGTNTVTLDAPDLVVDATYISILPGFVKGAARGEAVTAVPCTAVMVTH